MNHVRFEGCTRPPHNKNSCNVAGDMVCFSNNLVGAAEWRQIGEP